jgi:hypothetical protein
MSAWMSYARRHTFMLAVFACVVLAFVIRTWGISHGLPYAQLPDETGDIATALRIVAGDIPQYAFHRVAWSMVQIPVHALHFVSRYLQDPSFGISDFEALYFTQRETFLLHARLLAVFFSALTLVPLALSVRRLTQSAPIALASALALALHPQHNYLAHLALPDSFASFGVAIALWSVVAFVQEGKRWQILLLGLASAIAIFARLQTLLLIASLAIPILYRLLVLEQSHKLQALLRHALWAGGAFIFSALILNPFLVLAPANALADLQFIYSERYTGTYFEGSQIAQTSLSNSLNNAISNLNLPLTSLRPLWVLGATLGALAALWRRDILMLLIALSGLSFSLSLLPTPVPRLTYWLPALQTSLISAGYALTTLRTIDAREVRQSQWWVRIGLGAFGLALAFSAYETIRINQALSQADTRLLAHDAIRQSIPAESRILIGEVFVYSVPLARTASSIQRMAELRDLPPAYQFFLDYPELAPQPQYDLFGAEYQDSLKTDAKLDAFIADNAIQYVVVADYCQGGLSYASGSDIDFPPVPQQSALVQAWTLIASFSPFGVDDCLQPIENRTHMEYMRLGDWQRVGPIIRIYQVSG